MGGTRHAQLRLVATDDTPPADDGPGDPLELNLLAIGQEVGELGFRHRLEFGPHACRWERHSPTTPGLPMAWVHVATYRDPLAPEAVYRQVVGQDLTPSEEGAWVRAVFGTRTGVFRLDTVPGAGGHPQPRRVGFVGRIDGEDGRTARMDLGTPR